MMLLWDGICGQFASAIMTIVTQLIFCNCGFCDDSCEVSQFDFRNKPENLELTAPPPTLEDSTNYDGDPATTTMAKRFLFHPTADKCSATRTVQNHEEFGYWWQEVNHFTYVGRKLQQKSFHLRLFNVFFLLFNNILLYLLFSSFSFQGLCDNPECDAIKSTTGVEVNPSDFSRTYSGVYQDSEAGKNPGFARSVLDGGQAWSAKNLGDSMIIDAEEVVTLAGVITQGRFCPGPGLLEQIARNEDDCTWSAVNHECIQSRGQYAYCKPKYSGFKQYLAGQFSSLTNVAANVLNYFSKISIFKISKKTVRTLRSLADDV